MSKMIIGSRCNAILIAIGLMTATKLQKLY